jgi:SpoVK/Ycf46/Vps4 family AAA+-type ATPase
MPKHTKQTQINTKTNIPTVKFSKKPKLCPNFQKLRIPSIPPPSSTMAAVLRRLQIQLKNAAVENDTTVVSEHSWCFLLIQYDSNDLSLTQNLLVDLPIWRKALHGRHVRCGLKLSVPCADGKMRPCRLIGVPFSDQIDQIDRSTPIHKHRLEQKSPGTLSVQVAQVKSSTRIVQLWNTGGSADRLSIFRPMHRLIEMYAPNQQTYHTDENKIPQLMSSLRQLCACFGRGIDPILTTCATMFPHQVQDPALSAFCFRIQQALHACDPTNNVIAASGQCILLTGARGTGKTFLVDSISRLFRVPVFAIGLNHIVEQHASTGDDYEVILDRLWQRAVEFSPSIVLFDDAELLLPVKSMSPSSARLRKQLVELLERLNSESTPGSPVLGIVATISSTSIDASIRACCGVEVQCGIPDANQRHAILQNVLNMNKAEWLDRVARQCHGYVAADLVSLCRAAITQQYRERKDSTGVLPPIAELHFQKARRLVRPSALSEEPAAIPDVHWDDVGGLAAEKKVLQKAVVRSLTNADIYDQVGIRRPRGVLMHGPPGTGKTLLAKAVATEASANFIPISISDLMKADVGESEKAIARLFYRARAAAPCIIFIDEFQAIFATRSDSSSTVTKMISELMSQMDGLEDNKDVMVLAATNRIDMVDRSFLRPGRFDETLFIGPPDCQGRVEILQSLRTHSPAWNADIDIDDLAARTEQFTGADLNILAQHAGMVALTSDANAETIHHIHFVTALESVKPSGSQHE